MAEGRTRQDRQMGTTDSGEATPVAIDDQRIARRAYERYEARGRQDGGDLDDWYEAEQELRQQASGNHTSRTDDER